MKICDLTQFYSPFSGGVKRYVHEKIAYISNYSPDDAHVLIVPGPKTEVTTNARSRVYSIRSPLVSRSSRYRALLNLRAIEEILERERPDLIESSDPYQIGWKAIAAGRALRVPVVGFYHSHFPEAYLRGGTKFLGKRGTQRAMKLTRAYVRKLYNRFQATLVPSAGRLAKEKNTQTLFRALEILHQRGHNEFHLLVIGDGPQRSKLQKLQRRIGNISWISYCADSVDLARYYRAANLFVHPGVQETFGLVALESQACGTPVVGIRGSYMDRIICHDQKSWAQKNSPDALADAIEDFSAKKLSALGKTAAGTTERLYSWPRVFEELFCIYREVRANYRRF